MTNIDELMRLSSVIPVLIIDDPAKAQPLARSLVAKGHPVLEVTLRTPAALEVIAVAESSLGPPNRSDQRWPASESRLARKMSLVPALTRGAPPGTASVPRKYPVV